MTQLKRLKKHLESGKDITRLQGWDMGIIELPARICELRDQGMSIQTTIKTVTNRYGEQVRIAVWSLK